MLDFDNHEDFSLISYTKNSEKIWFLLAEWVHDQVCVGISKEKYTSVGANTGEDDIIKYKCGEFKDIFQARMSNIMYSLSGHSGTPLIGDKSPQPDSNSPLEKLYINEGNGDAPKNLANVIDSYDLFSYVRNDPYSILVIDCFSGPTIKLNAQVCRGLPQISSQLIDQSSHDSSKLWKVDGGCKDAWGFPLDIGNEKDLLKLGGFFMIKPNVATHPDIDDDGYISPPHVCGYTAYFQCDVLYLFYFTKMIFKCEQDGKEVSPAIEKTKVYVYELYENDENFDEESILEYTYKDYLKKLRAFVEAKTEDEKIDFVNKVSTIMMKYYFFYIMRTFTFMFANVPIDDIQMGSNGNEREKLMSGKLDLITGALCIGLMDIIQDVLDEIEVVRVEINTNNSGASLYCKLGNQEFKYGNSQASLTNLILNMLKTAEYREYNIPNGTSYFKPRSDEPLSDGDELDKFRDALIERFKEEIIKHNVVVNFKSVFQKIIEEDKKAEAFAFYCTIVCLSVCKTFGDTSHIVKVKLDENLFKKVENIEREIEDYNILSKEKLTQFSVNTVYLCVEERILFYRALFNDVNILANLGKMSIVRDFLSKKKNPCGKFDELLEEYYKNMSIFGKPNKNFDGQDEILDKELVKKWGLYMKIDVDKFTKIKSVFSYLENCLNKFLSKINSPISLGLKVNLYLFNVVLIEWIDVIKELFGLSNDPDETLDVIKLNFYDAFVDTYKGGSNNLSANNIDIEKWWENYRTTIRSEDFVKVFEIIELFEDEKLIVDSLNRAERFHGSELYIFFVNYSKIIDEIDNFDIIDEFDFPFPNSSLPPDLNEAVLAGEIFNEGKGRLADIVFVDKYEVFFKKFLSYVKLIKEIESLTSNVSLDKYLINHDIIAKYMKDELNGKIKVLDKLSEILGNIEKSQFIQYIYELEWYKEYELKSKNNDPYADVIALNTSRNAKSMLIKIDSYLDDISVILSFLRYYLDEKDESSEEENKIPQITRRVTRSLAAAQKRQMRPSTIAQRSAQKGGRVSYVNRVNNPMQKHFANPVQKYQQAVPMKKSLLPAVVDTTPTDVASAHLDGIFNKNSMTNEMKSKEKSSKELLNSQDVINEEEIQLEPENLLNMNASVLVDRYNSAANPIVGLKVVKEYCEKMKSPFIKTYLKILRGDPLVSGVLNKLPNKLVLLLSGLEDIYASILDDSLPHEDKFAYLLESEINIVSYKRDFGGNLYSLFSFIRFVKKEYDIDIESSDYDVNGTSENLNILYYFINNVFLLKEEVNFVDNEMISDILSLLFNIIVSDDCNIKFMAEHKIGLKILNMLNVSRSNISRIVINASLSEGSVLNYKDFDINIKDLKHYLETIFTKLFTLEVRREFTEMINFVCLYESDDYIIEESFLSLIYKIYGLTLHTNDDRQWRIQEEVLKVTESASKATEEKKYACLELNRIILKSMIGVNLNACEYIFNSNTTYPSTKTNVKISSDDFFSLSDLLIANTLNPKKKTNK